MLEHCVHCCEAERRKGAYILDFVSGVHHHGEILMEMFLSKIVFLHRQIVQVLKNLSLLDPLFI